MLAVLYEIADRAVLYHPRTRASLLSSRLQWNWSGKVFSIVLAAVVLASSPWLRRNVGLRLRQAKGSLAGSVGCFVLCLVGGWYLSLGQGSISFDAETLAFQLFMPSIAEELSDRGIALALLQRGFGGDPMSGRWQPNAAVWASAILFGLGHVQFDRTWPVNLQVFCLTGLVGVVLALVRGRSGSLVWPMLCHSAINVSIYGFAMAR